MSNGCLAHKFKILKLSVYIKRTTMLFGACVRVCVRACVFWYFDIGESICDVCWSQLV